MVGLVGHFQPTILPGQRKRLCLLHLPCFSMVGASLSAPNQGDLRGGTDNGLPDEYGEHAVHPWGVEGKTHIHPFGQVVPPFLHEAHPRGETHYTYLFTHTEMSIYF